MSTLGVGLAGSLISPGRGILWEFPALVLAPLGVRALWDGGQKTITLAFTGLVGVQLLNVAAWDVWWGGWGYGLRLFVPALPLLAVLVGCGIDSLSTATRRWFPWLLLMLGLVWAVPGVLTDMNSGYAARLDASAPNFQLDAYLPIGAWPYFDHWRAVSIVDFHAADIIWLRFARPTNNASLIVAALFLLSAAVLYARILFLQRQSSYGPGPRLLESSSSTPSDSPII